MKRRRVLGSRSGDVVVVISPYYSGDPGVDCDDGMGSDNE